MQKQPTDLIKIATRSPSLLIIVYHNQVPGEHEQLEQLEQLEQGAPNGVKFPCHWHPWLLVMARNNNCQVTRKNMWLMMTSPNEQPTSTIISKQRANNEWTIMINNQLSIMANNA